MDGVDGVDETGSTEVATWPSVLGTLTSGGDLRTSSAEWAMAQIMEGTATDAQVAAFGVALKMKGVTGRELDALATTMLRYSRHVRTGRDCLDIVGTGGDRHGTVNISTMSSIVVSACGVPVVKHGGRASSSKSGGADVLEVLGVAIDLGPDQVTQCLERAGVAFCFAPVFHPAMRFAAAPRREIGVPTVFNVLGPLTNPASPRASLIGCAFEPLRRTMAEVFALQERSALVVRGSDGLDEVTITGPTAVLRVHGGEITEDEIVPEDLGIASGELDDLRGGDAVVNAGVTRRLLDGEPGPVRDAVIMNSAAALVAWEGGGDGGGLAGALRGARERVEESIDSGAARRLLETWVTTSTSLRSGGGR